MRAALVLLFALVGAACSLAYGDKLGRLDESPLDASTPPGDAGGDAADQVAPDAPVEDAADAEGGAGLEVLAQDQAQPGALAVDDAYVYWVNEALSPMAIERCPIGGCAGPPTRLATGTTTGLASDGAFLYWADFTLGTLLKCATGGCNESPMPLVTGQDQAEGPAFDGVTLVWSTSQGGGSVRACTPGACATPATLAANQGFVVWLAAEPGRAAWTTTSAALTCPTAGCGGAPTTLAVAGRVPIAVAQGTAVWIRADGAIVACKSSGCGGAPRIVGSSVGPSSLTTDGVNVYWYDHLTEAVYACPIDGCTPGLERTLAKGILQSRDGAGMVVRGAYLYFTSSSAVLRAPK